MNCSLTDPRLGRSFELPLPYLLWTSQCYKLSETRFGTRGFPLTTFEPTSERHRDISRLLKNRDTNPSWGARQLGRASFLTSAGRVTLAGGTSFILRIT